MNHLRQSVVPSDHLFYWHYSSASAISFQLSLERRVVQERAGQLTRKPDGPFSQMFVAPDQHWAHCTVFRSVLASCLWYLYFIKSSASSHSAYINNTLWSFFLSPIPQLKQSLCLIKHNPSFFPVPTSCVYLWVSASLRVTTSGSTYGEILQLPTPSRGYRVVVLISEYRGNSLLSYHHHIINSNRTGSDKHSSDRRSIKPKINYMLLHG